ncbi:MAG: LPO_1073/Vpar_1526 family protein [Eubacteriales bacterium]
MNPMIQKAGDDSTNIQAEKVFINNGLSYQDVKEICSDVFHDNFMKMRNEASQLAQDRAEQITEDFLASLQKNNPEGLNCAQDPDFQYSLFEVQKEYAKTGDKELGDLLVNLLLDRTKQPKRSILQIVLNESISVASKLTAEQIDALSVAFLMRYTRNTNVINIFTFKKYLDEHYFPYSSTINKNDSCYQHLQYAGCGSISIGSFDIRNLLKNTYGGIFSKGFDLNTLGEFGNDLLHFPQILATCLHDNQKMQMNAMSIDVLNSSIASLEIEAEMAGKIRDLYNNSLMDDEQVEKYVISLCDYMNNIFEVWKNSKLQNFQLTSVGIAIGHANVKKHISNFSDLSIWIN